MANCVKVRNLTIGEGIPKICVPVLGRTAEEILKQLEDARKAGADLIEWRGDWYEDVSEESKVLALLENIREGIKEIPLLFTFRTEAEGGEQEISIENYEKLIKKVAESKLVDMIDVEAYMQEGLLAAMVSEVSSYGVKVIASNHDFSKTPSKENIIERLKYMQTSGADIAKIAVMPNSREDVFALLSATFEMTGNNSKTPIVTMSMNKAGVISRVTGEFFGSAITFASAGRTSAPGQVETGSLKQILDILHDS